MVAICPQCCFEEAVRAADGPYAPNTYPDKTIRGSNLVDHLFIPHRQVLLGAPHERMLIASSISRKEGAHQPWDSQ